MGIQGSSDRNEDVMMKAICYPGMTYEREGCMGVGDLLLRI